MVELTRNLLVEKCKTYIRAKHCTIWSDWDVSGDKGLTKAATWLAEQILGVGEIAYSTQEADEIRWTIADEAITWTDAYEGEYSHIGRLDHPSVGNNGRGLFEHRIQQNKSLQQIRWLVAQLRKKEKESDAGG